MKKAVIGVGIVAVLGAGIWWLARRPQGHQGLEAAPEAFRTETSGPGTLITYDDALTPLRSFRWLRPLPDGFLVAQVLTQTDRQEVVLFQEARLLARIVVPRPEGVGEGFWRLAELREAAVLPGDALLLLYRAPNGQEQGLAVALDLAGHALRWHLQTPAEHLALDPAQGGAAYLYSAHGTILRTPVPLQKGEAPGQGRKAPKGIDLPPEVQRVTDLLPTGPGAFLLAHPQGLSAYRNQAWSHEAAPPPSGLGFVEPRGRLARSRDRLWWQPEPRRLVQVGPDAKPIKTWEATTFAIAEPQSKDGALLQLLGADPDGRLWFALAAPTLPLTKPGASPAPPPSEGPWVAEGEARTDAPPAEPAFDRPAWEEYLRLGLGRLYRFDPAKGAFERLEWTEAWPKLNAPGIQVPPGDAGLRPESGGILVGDPQRVWWLPLKALSLTGVGSAKP